MDLQEVVCGGMDWIDLVQYRYRSRALLNAVFGLVPSKTQFVLFFDGTKPYSIFLIYTTGWTPLKIKLLKTVMNLRVPQIAGNLLTS
jgi:hypothetical protein